MKKTWTAQKLIDSFVEQALITEKAMRINDYRTNNKSATQLIKLFKIYENDIELAKEVLIALLKHESLSVKSYAAADSLVLGICVKEAEKILEKISKENGLIGFNAQMCLEQWRKGELKVYRK